MAHFDLSERHVNFLKKRKLNRKKMLISGLSSVAFFALASVWINFSILGIISVAVSYFVYIQGLRIKCPKCQKKFSVSGFGDAIRGDGWHACYHCGYNIEGEFKHSSTQHDKEWLD